MKTLPEIIRLVADEMEDNLEQIADAGHGCHAAYDLMRRCVLTYEEQQLFVDWIEETIAPYQTLRSHLYHTEGKLRGDKYRIHWYRDQAYELEGKK